VIPSMLISDATERFGSRILEATDIEDLDERIDHVIDDPAYADMNAFLAQIFISDALIQIEQRHINIEHESLGILRESRDMANELTKNLRGHIDFIDGERIVPSILVNDRVPVPIRKVLFAMYRSSIASLGLGEYVRKNRVLDTWLSRALCKRIRDGLRHHLSLAASLALLRQSSHWHERMDLVTIYEQHRVSRAKADADLARHRADDVVRERASRDC
jgi:hypothetical protein